METADRTTKKQEPGAIIMATLSWLAASVVVGFVDTSGYRGKSRLDVHFVATSSADGHNDNHRYRRWLQSGHIPRVQCTYYQRNGVPMKSVSVQQQLSDCNVIRNVDIWIFTPELHAFTH